MIAKDIMTRDVIVAKPHDKLEKIAEILVDNKFSGVPVVDDNFHVVGVITERDLMIRAQDLKIPFYVTIFDSIIFLENPIKFKDEIKKHTAVEVQDVMTKKVISVEEDVDISEIVDLMTRKNINRVPVLRHGKLVGIITRNDILKALVKHDA